MKAIQFFLLFLVFLAACKTQKPNPTAPKSKTAFIPHDIGQYWVYEYSDFQNPDTKPYKDTLKVLKHEQSAEGLKVDLNQGRWLIKAGGDSIFTRCATRGGPEFSMPRYQRCEGESEFQSCMGDVVQAAKVKKMNEAQQIKGKTYTGCYQFNFQPYFEVIVCEGVGIVRQAYHDLNGKIMNESLLIEHGKNKEQ